jgi:hypothetical protein
MIRRLDRALFDDESSHIDRFGWLLAVTVAAIVVLSLIDLAPPESDLPADIGLAVVTLFVGAAFVLSLRAAGVARRWRRAADVLVGLAILSSVLLIAGELVVDADADAGRGDRTPSFLWLVLSASTPFAVTRRILKHRRVTVATLLGAISTYLLIAVTFTYLFLAVDAAQTEPFFAGAEPTTSFMYFSLTTVTTLGFGDLSPTTELGRLLATTEAVVGQIFLVTLVAALVGLFAQGARTTSDQ